MEKSTTRLENNKINHNEEVKLTNKEQIKEITEAQRDGIRFDYTDSSDFS